MPMSKYELRAWLAGILWIVLYAVAFPSDFQGWFGIFFRAVLAGIAGWYMGMARHNK